MLPTLVVVMRFSSRLPGLWSTSSPVITRVRLAKSRRYLTNTPMEPLLVL